MSAYTQSGHTGASFRKGQRSDEEFSGWAAAIPLIETLSRRGLIDCARKQPCHHSPRWVKARNCGCKIALQIRLRKLGQTYIFSWNTI